MRGTRMQTAVVAGAVLAAGAVHGTRAAADTNAPPASTNLPPLTVVASAIAPAWVYGQVDTLSRALATTPAVVINAQGGDGAQNDLSIRGSSFSGAGLAVGGLSLRNPQTEHFNSELPLPSSLFTAPRVLTGLDQARGTDGHLVGSVALDFAPTTNTRRLSGGIGEVDRRWGSAFVEQPVVSDGADGTWSAGAFGAAESAEHIDYPDNDLDLWNGGGHLQFNRPDLQVDVAGGVQEKEFGARGYYGVSDTLPAQEKLEDAMVLVSARQGELEGDFRRVTAHWRELDDTYDILPAVFHNETKSRVLAIGTDGRLTITEPLNLDWRAGYEDESMDGLTLGDQDRERGLVSAIPGWNTGPATLSAGARGEFFTDDSPAWLPQAGVDLRTDARGTVYVSYTESVRQPSFTELNYESPGSLGNTGLERQEAQTLEVGVRRQLCPQSEARAAVFQQWDDQSVDWVRPTVDSKRFEAVNLDEVDTLGVEIGVRGDIGRSFGLDAQYTWVEKDTDADPYASRYVLDYPEHLLQLSAVWRVTQTLSLAGTQGLRRQTDNALRTSDDVGALGSLALYVALPKLPQAVLTVAVDNAWDDDFQAFAGQQTAGRRASAGVTVDW